MIEQQRWLPSVGPTFSLKDLADFVAWAYGSGCTDTTQIRVETNLTLKPSQVGIRKAWTEEVR